MKMGVQSNLQIVIIIPLLKTLARQLWLQQSSNHHTEKKKKKKLNYHFCGAILNLPQRERILTRTWSQYMGSGSTEAES